MTTKDKDAELKLSPSTAVNLGKIAVALLGAMAAGGAGSVALAPDGSAEQEARITELERSCKGYDVRIATAETKVSGVEANVLEIKRDLQEIRTTSTQILLLIKQDK